MEKYLKTLYEDFLNRVDYLISVEKKTLEEIGKLCGASKATVFNWKNRDLKSIDVHNFGRYCDALGITNQEDRAPVIRRNNPMAKEESVEGEDVTTIQVYSRAGAGPSVAVTDLEPLFSVTAPASYLYRCDFAVLVDGHSMEPTIPHQAVVGVREVEEFRANELYVACIPYEGLVVKRIAVDREKDEFVFKSDNPDKEAYPEFREPTVSAEKIIMGRVVWMLRGY